MVLNAPFILYEDEGGPGVLYADFGRSKPNLLEDLSIRRSKTLTWILFPFFIPANLTWILTFILLKIQMMLSAQTQSDGITL